MDRQKPRRVRMWQKRLENINREKSAGQLLDIGCEESLFPKTAQERGWSIKGPKYPNLHVRRLPKILEKKYGLVRYEMHAFMAPHLML